MCRKGLGANGVLEDLYDFLIVAGASGAAKPHPPIGVANGRQCVDEAQACEVMEILARFRRQSVMTMAAIGLVVACLLLLGNGADSKSKSIVYPAAAILAVSLEYLLVRFLISLVGPRRRPDGRRNAVDAGARSWQISGAILLAGVGPILGVFRLEAAVILATLVGLSILIVSSSVRAAHADALQREKIGGSGWRVFLISMRNLGFVGVFGCGVAMYERWFSCGCWENVTANIWATIVLYTLGIGLVSRGLFRKLGTIKVVSSVFCLAIVVGYLLPYISPFKIPHLLDSTFGMFSYYPVVEAPFHALVCMKIRYALPDGN